MSFTWPESWAAWSGNTWLILNILCSLPLDGGNYITGFFKLLLPRLYPWTAKKINLLFINWLLSQYFIKKGKKGRKRIYIYTFSCHIYKYTYVYMCVYIWQEATISLRSHLGLEKRHRLRQSGNFTVNMLDFIILVNFKTISYILYILLYAALWHASADAPMLLPVVCWKNNPTGLVTEHYSLLFRATLDPHS